MTRRIGMVAEPYHRGRAGIYLKAGEVLAALGAAGSLAGSPSSASGRSKAINALSGAALLGASAATRFGIFHAGLASANDPKYTVIPQRERLQHRNDRFPSLPGEPSP